MIVCVFLHRNVGSDECCGLFTNSCCNSSFKNLKDYYYSNEGQVQSKILKEYWQLGNTNPIANNPSSNNKALKLVTNNKHLVPTERSRNG